MDHFSHLWLFFLMVLGIIVLPGLDMAFVLASSLAGGRRAGLVAVAGTVAGGAVHVAAGACGVGLLFQLVPGMVNVLLVAGALYIAWIGLSLLRSQPGAGGGDLPQTAVRSSWATFRQAMLTCLLNPKAYLFMLAIFPQFLRLEYGPVWIQALALGFIIAITQIAVYGGLALAAGSAQGWLRDKPGAGLMLARAVGVLLILGAVVTVMGAFKVG